MKYALIATTILTTLAVGGAWAAGSTETFMTKAMQGNLAEIQAGTLAQQRGNSQAVRDFGQMLVTDHTAANQRAVGLAAEMGVDVPTTPSNEQQAMYKTLSKYKGAEFDRKFVDAMEDAHKDTIDLYEDEAGRKDDGKVQALAAETLPTLRNHLSTVQKIDGQLK